MTDERLFERLAMHGGPADVDPGFVDRLHALLQQEMRRPKRSARPALLLVAALLLALALGGAALVGSGVVELPVLPVLPDSSAPPTDVVWSEERATQDWPGALRVEPAGGAPIVPPTTLSSPDRTPLHSDPKGDVPAEVAFVDIVTVEYRDQCYMSLNTEVCVFFDLSAVLAQPMPDPRDQWIAYGLVVDTTGDGRPDLRYGMDNYSGNVHRHWRTDLASETESSAPGIYEDRLGDSVFPNEEVWNPPFPIGPGALPSSRGAPHLFVYRHGEPFFRFYVWASVISEGQIIATDYAPDVGWLAITRGTTD